MVKGLILTLCFLAIAFASANAQTACSNRYVNLVGSWRESSGKTWVSTQEGSHFTWVQQGTGRKATGFIVAPCHTSTSYAYITFDGSVHWKVSISADTNTVHGPTDTFTRVVSTQPTTGPRGSYKENSGKIWNVTSNTCNSFTLRNRQDGRSAEGVFSLDPQTGLYSIYVTFHDTNGDVNLRGTTPNMDLWQMSNGDIFRRV